jgi:hypothetical protein
MIMLDGICKIKLYIASFHALTEAQKDHILKINGGFTIVFSKHSYQQAWSKAIGLSYSDVISFR